MCGIAGFIKSAGKSVSEPEVSAMLNLIRYRGPDDSGTVIEKNVGLGSVRLSIIGVANGKMPIKNADESMWIVYNGEVYNHKQYKNELIQKGHQFYTQSDTEVILHLYQEDGIECFGKLNGMFGIAIWDKKKNKIILARDQLGQKPVYYAIGKEGFLFASEIKCILENAPELRKVSQAGLMSYMTLGYTLDSLTMYEGIRELPPGHFLVYDIDSQAIEIKKYWHLQFLPNYDRSYEETKNELRQRMIQSVDSRMMSEVPVSIFLSGGIDSTVVGGIVAKELGQKLHSFALGFKPETGGGAVRFNDDVVHAEIVAERLGFNHHEYKVDFGSQLPDIFHQVAWQYDQPCYAPTLIPLYLLSQQVAQNFKVTLTGDGGDELFCGYEMYNIEKKYSGFNQIPSMIRSPIFGVLGNLNFLKQGMRNQFYRISTNSSTDRYLTWKEIFRGDQLPKVMNQFSPAVYKDFHHYLDRTGFFEKGASDYTPHLAYNDILFWISSHATTCFDRMTMASSLEARSSFLDHKLVEFSQTIPYEYKLKDGVTKAILKDAFVDVIPKEILTRNKGSMLSPSSHWIRVQLNKLFSELFSKEAIERAGLLDYDFVQKVFSDHVSRKQYNMISVWTLASLQLWHEMHIQQIRKPNRV